MLKMQNPDKEYPSNIGLLGNRLQNVFENKIRCGNY
jgi:hypothetical protein